MTLVSLPSMSPASGIPHHDWVQRLSDAGGQHTLHLSKAWFVPVALGLTIGGMLGVPLAAFVVKSLPLAALRYMVIVIVLYAAVLMLRKRDRLPVRTLLARYVPPSTDCLMVGHCVLFKFGWTPIAIADWRSLRVERHFVR